jgi:hypothetical protein
MEFLMNNQTQQNNRLSMKLLMNNQTQQNKRLSMKTNRIYMPACGFAQVAKLNKPNLKQFCKSVSL